jgi:hypothetical protein
MAKARVQSLRAELVPVYPDHFKDEDAEETLDESMDPLEESGHTVDTSDEEVDDMVADEIIRFEESFAGINKRYRLVNRIGEGECIDWLRACRGATSTDILSQAPSRPCTRRKTWNTTCTRTAGTLTSKRAANGRRRVTAGNHPNARIMLPSSASMSPAAPCVSSMSWRFRMSAHHCIPPPGPGCCRSALLCPSRLPRLLQGHGDS